MPRKRRQPGTEEPFTDSDCAAAMFDGGGVPMKGGCRLVPPALIRAYIEREVARGALDAEQAATPLDRLNQRQVHTNQLPKGAPK